MIPIFDDSLVWRDGTAFDVRAVQLDSSRFLLFYKDVGRGGRGVSRVVRLGDSAPSFGDEFEFSSENDEVGADSLAAAAIDSSRALVCWRRAATNAGVARVAETGMAIDGLDMSVSFGGEQQFYPDSADAAVLLCCLATVVLCEETAIVAFLDRAAGIAAVAAGAITGTEIAFEEPTTFETTESSAITLVGLDCSSAMILFRGADGSGVSATVTVDDDGMASVGGRTTFIEPGDVNWITPLPFDPVLVIYEDRESGTSGLSPAQAPSTGPPTTTRPVTTEPAVPATTTRPAHTTAPVAQTTGPVSGNVCMRSLPETYMPGVPFTVTIETFIDQGITIVYGVLETYPAGWTVSDITGPGDDTGTMVNWTFLDNQNETVTYTLTPPLGASGQAVWSGELGSMGLQGSAVVPVTGDTTVEQAGGSILAGALAPTSEPGFVLTGDLEHLTSARLGPDKALLAYRSNSANRHGMAVVIDVFGLDVAFGELRSFRGGRVEEVLAIALENQYRGLILYRTGTEMRASPFTAA